LLEHSLERRLTGEGEPALTGTLVADVFGRRVSLRAVDASGSGDDYLFEAEVSGPLVDLGDGGSFTLSRLMIRFAGSGAGALGSSQPSFEIEGKGRLQLGKLPALGPDPLIFEGDLLAVRAFATDELHVRIDFEEQPVAIALPGGFGLLLSLRRLYLI